jgi:hypothetical protein
MPNNVFLLISSTRSNFDTCLTYYLQRSKLPNLCVKCDKHPANNCVIFYGSEVLSVFNFVVGACALRE